MQILAKLMCTSALASLAWGQFEDLPRLKNYGAYRSSSNNPDLNSNDDSKRPIPGETIVLADLTGPGIVNHIWLTVAANEYGWPRLLRFRVYYDGSPTPSVDVPLGDFFAVGHGMEKPVESLVIRNGSAGRSRNSYWPMPFRKSCRITVTNEGRRRVSNLYYHVDWRKVPTLAPDTAYFHAWYRQELPTVMGRHYPILDVKGRGHYVGTVLSVIQNQAGWFGEGDEYFFVDGEKKPRIEGTGTEDYFNDAWSLRVADGPYTGVSVAEGTGVGSRMTAWRWHIPDPVPFTKSLRFEIEHAGWTYNTDGSVRSGFEERADLFSSVAYWYQSGIAQGLPEVPYGAARLPQGNARQIEVENYISDVKTTSGKASVEKEVFWSRDLLAFDATGAGSRIEIPFNVEDTGRYELIAQIAHSPDYGIYKVLLDGKPIHDSSVLEHEPGATAVADEPIDAYFTETYVAVDHTLGWPKLDRGRHVVAFECIGKNAQASAFRLGIDTLIVARVAGDYTVPAAEQDVERHASRVRASRRVAELMPSLIDKSETVRIAAAWALTQLDAAAAPAAGPLTQALSDDSPVVRGLVEIALASMGRVAKPALPLLIERLKDADQNVRLKAAVAIGAQGSSAAPAVNALMAASRIEGEHVQVLRPIALALGEIGPAAARAIPDLRRLEKIPRVSWAATLAIHKIEQPDHSPSVKAR